MTVPATSAAPVKLRLNYGSHAEIVRVYALDLRNDTALVRLRWRDGSESIDVHGLIEMEAVHEDAAGTFAVLNTEVLRRAEDVLAADR